MFEPIIDTKEINRLLAEGVKTLAPTILWTLNQEQTVQTYLNLFNPDEGFFRVWKPADLDPKNFENVKECFFNLSLVRANLFFKSTLTSFVPEGIHFVKPEKIFKVQRRSYFRLPISDRISLKIKFEDPIFPESHMSKDVLDMSAGGLSFLVSDQEEALFEPGLILKKLEFDLNEKKIKCEGEVRYFKVFPINSRTPGVKIGIKFHHMKPEDSQIIATFVFKESRKFFSRLL